MPSVLITGANRGIGLAFAQSYAAAAWKVFAAVRTASSMPELKGDVTVVTIASDSLTDAGDVAKKLAADGVKLDVVIANAGIAPSPDNFADLDPTVLDHAFSVNVRGVLVLFQAVKPLLTKDGKFIAISSYAGVIGRDHQQGGGAYGITKAALNFLVRKLHFENPDILVAGLHPGWVHTDMGESVARLRGREKAPDDIKQTVPGMIKLINEGDKEKLGGWLTTWEGKRLTY